MLWSYVLDISRGDIIWLNQDSVRHYGPDEKWVSAALASRDRAINCKTRIPWAKALQPRKQDYTGTESSYKLHFISLPNFRKEVEKFSWV